MEELTSCSSIRGCSWLGDTASNALQVGILAQLQTELIKQATSQRSSDSQNTV